MKIIPTSCCALAQVRAGNDDPIEDIGRAIERLKRETYRDHFETGLDGGQRALFCIVSPGETQLQRNLIELGFKETYQFNRRHGYPKGRLGMWMLSW